MLKNNRFLPTITTTDKNHFRKLAEVKELGLEEICLFPTTIAYEERKSLYRELEKTRVKKIPLVHLREDFKVEEIEYFSIRYQTEIFNTHPAEQSPIPPEWLKYKKRIYIENTLYAWDKKEVQNFGGICLDFAHLEDTRRLRREIYQKNLEIIGRFFCGCGHLSGVNNEKKYSRKFGVEYYSDHLFRDYSDFDFLKKYPKKYFPEIIALELENPIKEQLKLSEYLEKKLNL